MDEEADLYKGVDRAGRLRKLSGIYSHFRPVGPDEDRRPRRQHHPAGDVPAFPYVGNTVPTAALRNEAEVPSQIVSLEPHELFSQLCTIANLVKAVPNVGFLLNCITIGEGVIRIWRDWLAERAVLPQYKGEASLRTSSFEDKERILWLDNGCNIGIGLRVIEREDLGTPILMRLDEDAHVAYSIEYEGWLHPPQTSLTSEANQSTELVIRTTQLLLKFEESLLQETNETSKAIIIGSFERSN